MNWLSEDLGKSCYCKALKGKQGPSIGSCSGMSSSVALVVSKSGRCLKGRLMSFSHPDNETGGARFNGQKGPYSLSRGLATCSKR